MPLPPAVPALAAFFHSAAIVQRLGHCWADVPAPPGSSVSVTMCAALVDPDGIGLCEAHLSKLRDPQPT